MLIGHAFFIASGEPAVPIAYEHVANKTLYSGAAATSHTFARAMTRSSGANRLGTWFIGVEGANGVIVTVTYNGVAVSLIGAQTDVEATPNRIELWGLRGASLPGDTSNHDVVITPVGTTAVMTQMVEFDGNSSLTPTWTDGDNTDPTPAALSGTSLEGDLVLYGICTNVAVGAPDNFAFASGTEIVDAENNSFWIGASYQLNVAAGTQGEQATAVETGGRAASFACSLPRAT